MEISTSSDIAFNNQAVNQKSFKQHQSSVRLNYKTFGEKNKDMVRLKHSLLKEIYDGLSKPTPEWAIYGLFLNNIVFILVVLLSLIFDVMPNNVLSDYIKVFGVVINSYLNIYLRSRT